MADTGGNKKWYPNFEPYVQMRDELTWLKVVPKKIDTVSNNTRSRTGYLGTKQDGTTRYFLLPDEISYSISHTWNDFSTVIGMVKELVSKIVPQAGQVDSLVKGFGSVNYGGGEKGIMKVATEIQKGAVMNASDIAMKNDNPVVYSNSQRKNISVNIELATYSDAYSDVYEPIHDLMKLSSPDDSSDGNAGVSFQYPHIFEVSIVSGKDEKTTIFHMKDSALVSVQPEFRAPYINGYPTHASLNLSFSDLTPLFSSLSFSYNSNVTVKTTATKKEFAKDKNKISPPQQKPNERKYENKYSGMFDPKSGMPKNKNFDPKNGILGTIIKRLGMGGGG